MAWLALAIIYVVWGSTYLAIRVMVDTMPPLLSAGVAFTRAGAAFWLVLGLVKGAEQERPSGCAALIIGCLPLVFVVLRSLRGARPVRGTLAGVLVGFVGLAILVLPGDRPEDAPLWGLLVLIAAAVLWATGSFYAT